LDNLITLNLNANQALKVIKNIITEHPKRLIWTKHVQIRMVERGFTADDVMECLLHGRVIEGPSKEPSGAWKLNIELNKADMHLITVTVLDEDKHGNKIVIVTVFEG
jgi:hypothetical protein